MKTSVRKDVVTVSYGDYNPPDKIRKFKVGDKVKHSAQYIKNITYAGKFDKKFIEDAKKDRGVVVYLCEGTDEFVFVQWQIGIKGPFSGKTGSIHTSNIVKSR